jgi:hypothetical protein
MKVLFFSKNLFFPLFFLAVTAFSQEPRWFANPGLVYPPETYITGVGGGRTAEEARDRALMQISLYFNASIQAQTDLQETYRETTQNGRSSSVQNTSVSESISVGSQADFFGVFFEPPYTDRRRTVPVLARINRAEAAAVYDSRIRDCTALATDILNANENGPNPFAALNKLHRTRNIAELASGYADMARLVSGVSASRYTQIPALVSRIDRAIENNRKRLTVSVTLNDERARSLALKTAEILRGEGFLITDAGGEYTVSVNIQFNEGVTQNYHTVRPLVDITISMRDGDTPVRYQKEYAVFRHITQGEALGRALRNIEQDIGGEFSAQLRRLEE